VQELVPDYLEALQKEPECFYVIYKGPHAGLHTNWGISETFCKEDKVTCKKFRNEAYARASLAMYSSGARTSTKKVLLRPKIQTVKEDHRDQRFLIPKETQQAVADAPVEAGEFRELWNKALLAGLEDFSNEHFYTTDKKSKSLFNFVEGADPMLTYQAFRAGLVHNIYPSSNLQEIRYFPNDLITAIKTFRRKVLKAKDEPIYINTVSSLPDWQHEARFLPYHFLEIGLAKSKREVTSSLPMEDKDLPFPEIIHPVRLNGLRGIGNKDLLIKENTSQLINWPSKK